MDIKRHEPICHEGAKCFAKANGKCTILEKSYKDKNCPFCKPEREVTKGKRYPYDPLYGSASR